MNLWRTFQSSPYFYWTFLGLLWSSVSFFGKQSTAIMPSFRLTGVSQPPWNAFRGPSDEPGLLQTCFLPINVNGKEHKRLLMMLTTFSSLPLDIFPFCVYLYRPQIKRRLCSFPLTLIGKKQVWSRPGSSDGPRKAFQGGWETPVNRKLGIIAVDCLPKKDTEDQSKPKNVQ